MHTYNESLTDAVVDFKVTRAKFAQYIFDFAAEHGVTGRRHIYPRQGKGAIEAILHKRDKPIDLLISKDVIDSELGFG